MVILEYVWIDAFGGLRSKTKVLPNIKYIDNNVPEWNFDGSSTGQATGFKSDIILRHKEIFRDPFRRNIRNHYDENVNCYLIMCDTYLPNGQPHATNTRAKCVELESKTMDLIPYFGIEQEYILYDTTTHLPYNWTSKDLPSEKLKEQGPFYCGSGGDRVFGRDIAEEHLEHCLYAGIEICGINAEVTPSQWEFQVGPIGPTAIGDHLWMARYILNRITEKHNCYAEYHPKPMKMWNGSGCHTNFSTKNMRETDHFSENNKTGLDEIVIACEKLKLKHDEHLEVYGDTEQNKLRLTGNHETASFKKFTYGVSDRGTSIRIPLNVANEKCGYLEDRRPASNMDPYKVVSALLETVCM
jgi:glutamine synthetase